MKIKRVINNQLGSRLIRAEYAGKEVVFLYNGRVIEYATFINKIILTQATQEQVADIAQAFINTQYYKALNHVMALKEAAFTSI